MRNTRIAAIRNLQITDELSCIEISHNLLSVSLIQNGMWAMTIYGYARVSTDGQSVATQEAQLLAAGCAKVYSEKMSGKATDGRAELAKVIRRLDKGDVLMVTRLDRLARSTRDLLNLLHDLTERGVKFKALDDAWADTTSMHGELMITLLAGIATFERRLILARTDEGRKRAKARGVRFGRPLALTPHQRQEALQRLANGEAQADVARSFDVGQATISRLAATIGPFPVAASA
jgi:DNA invertase Pin-like site-specific DNA recombinase